ncbi:MAG TPA: molybdate ABC transporter substrate-binding protein [Bryobacteraceae bacterium]|nr:molybdate ABC transporter substrate-binding protein [Bryobacteraceae bacterium]
MSRILSSSLLLFLSISVPLCVAQQTLTVATAADLAPLQPDLLKLYPHLRFVTSASAILMQQIENGAPYDVFLSANAAYVDQLAQKRKIEPDSVVVYAVGRLGLLWRDGKPREFKDLADPAVRLVIFANPKLAPYGLAARQSIEHAGIWGKVESKIVYAENVRQALEIFESGNGDAVLTSASLLQGKPAQLVPNDWHAPIEQKAGVVSASPNQTAARGFLKQLTGPAGQAVFARHGFARPAP